MFNCINLLKFAFFNSGGQRNWIQVICNAGMATFLAVLYILDYGSGELAVNFSSQYRASWLSVGILGNFILLIKILVEYF